MISRRLRWLLGLAFACLWAVFFAACGSTDGSTFGASSGSSGSSGDGSNGGFPPSFGEAGGGGKTSTSITIDPPSAALTVTSRSTLPSQAFVAKRAATGAAVPAAWTLDEYTAGTVDGSGVFRAKGTVSATVRIIAAYGGATAFATLKVAIDAKEDLADVTLPDGTSIQQDASGISAANRAALGGAPVNESGAVTTIVYPYDGTVVPRGLLAPVPQFTAGASPPQDFKVILETFGFHWEGFGHVASPTALQAGLPQDVWAGALLSAQPDPSTQKRTVSLSIVKAVNGVAYGPATTHLVVAPATLTGIIYYSSYSQDQLQMDGDAGGGQDFGLWSVRPGTTDPPTHLDTGCVICHSVSANGRVLSTGMDANSNGAASGVYATTGTSATLTAGAPGGLAGDTRYFSWAVLTPDGAYALRSKTNFWGGDQLLAWKTPDPDAGASSAPLSASVPVNGTNIPTFVPSFSTDGTKLVYVNADAAHGPTSRSVGIMDVAVDPMAAPNGAITLSSPRTIYDSTKPGATPSADYTRVPMFLPDSENIVLQETDGTRTTDGFDEMLPNWAGTAHVYTPGALYLLRSLGSGLYENVELAQANAGSIAQIRTANYEPKPLPVQVGGYFWVVFTSVRADGLNGPAVKKLWVTALSPNAPPGSDPSHPPFLLTNQSIIPTQACERGYWSVEPCHADGATCASGDDCCNGFCRPETDGDPSSPLVCKKPPATTCASVGDRCRSGHSEDCCNAAEGVSCIGSLGGFGSCAVPGLR